MLRLLRTEKTVEIRMYHDHNFVEAFFQKGRVAMTTMSTMPTGPPQLLSDSADVALLSTAAVMASEVDIYSIGPIWGTPSTSAR